MTLSEAVKQRIIDLTYSKDMSLHKLAIKSGLSYSTLNSFLNGKCTSPRVVTLLHLCEGLDIELKDFFDDKLFFEVEEDN